MKERESFRKAIKLYYVRENEMKRIQEEIRTLEGKMYAIHSVSFLVINDKKVDREERIVSYMTKRDRLRLEFNLLKEMNLCIVDALNEIDDIRIQEAYHLAYVQRLGVKKVAELYCMNGRYLSNLMKDALESIDWKKYLHIYERLDRQKEELKKMGN
ncbi:MAG: hypothetical protein IJ875_00665 [Solobacterium sp.]|nr:hypothetical protein [Solobacterium sp.]